MACHLLCRRKHQGKYNCGIRVASQHTPPRRFSGRGLAILKMRKLPVQYVETLALPLGPMASLSAMSFSSVGPRAVIARLSLPSSRRLTISLGGELPERVLIV